MGVRFSGNINTDHTGVVYTVKIIDPTWSSTGVSALTFFGEGFELTYMQEGDERFAPIKGSEVKVNIVVTDDAAGLTIQSWILNSLLNQKEQYYIRIEKDGNLFWYGILLPDLSEREDISRPYNYVIKATDGLARLKDTPFDRAAEAANANSSAYAETFKDIIYRILKYTPLYLTTTETGLFSTCVGWYEAQMPPKDGYTDPLDYTRINPAVFADKLDDSTYEGKSLYESLAIICETWGMRCIFSDGLYRFYQVSSYPDDSITKYERFYRRSNGGIYDTIDFSAYPVTVTNDNFPYVKAGGAFTNFPPLKNVILNYRLGPYSNLLDTETSMTTSSPWAYTKTLRDNILGGTGKYLKLTTVLGILNSNQTIVFPRYPKYYNITIKLKIGSYYLKSNANGFTEWTTNSADRYYLVISGLANPTAWLNISFKIPEIPSGTHSSNEFSLTITQAYDQYYLPYGAGFYDVSRAQGSTWLIYGTVINADTDPYYEYIGQNTNTTINSYDIQLEDTRIGEGLDASNPGNLYVYDGANWQPSGSQWTVEQLGTAYDFNIVRVRDVVAGQIYATFKYQGVFISAEVLPHSSINYDGYRFILNGGTLNARSEEFSGEWFQVSYDYDNTDDNGGTILNGNGGDQQLRREIGSVQDSVYNIFGQLQQNGVVTTGVSNSVTLTALSQIAYSTGTVTFYLAPAADWVINGMSSVIDIVNTGSTGNVVTIVPDGSETVYGETSLTLNNGESASLWSDGNNIWAK